VGLTIGKKGVRADLNLTPMIDILLVLLIIFMVMQPLTLMQHRVEVPRRTEVDAPEDVSRDQLVLTFTKEGQVFLNRTRIERWELGRELSERFKLRREKVVFLNIDPQANYGEAMSLVDSVKSAGVDKLAVITQKPGDPFSVPGQDGGE
jgi:biopolymer transport protein TolR